MKRVVLFDLLGLGVHGDVGVVVLEGVGRSHVVVLVVHLNKTVNFNYFNLRRLI
jgi:hypothetical protein